MLLQVQALQLRIPNSYLLLIHSLPPEFDSFVDAIQFQIGSTTIDELHGLLMSKEIQLNNRKKASFATPYSSSVGIIPTPPNTNPSSQAFTAQNFSNQGCGLECNTLNHNYNQNRDNVRNNNNNQRHNYYHNNNQRKNFNHGGRNNFQCFGKKISCQICKQFDHEALGLSSMDECKL